MEGVVGLFDTLKEAFRFSKGALMIRNGDEEFFLPLAQSGLDVTSRNRIRYPVDGVTPGESGWLASPDASLLEPYLSSREYGLVEELLILPLHGELEPVGILLIIGEDEESFSHLHALRTNDLTRIEQAMSRFFDGNKLLRIGSSAPSEPSEPALIEFVEKMLAQQRMLTALTFDVSPLLERLSGISADVDLFRARKDTLRIIETLFEGNSRIVPLHNESYLLLLSSKKRQNPRLLQHQVGLALQNFFSDSQTMIDFTPVEIPDDIASARTLVEEILLSG